MTNNLTHGKKVLLTGGTGLIGKEAIPFLCQSGFDVYALTTQTHPSDEKVHWITADLLDWTVVKEVLRNVKPQYLLHFAWGLSKGYITSTTNFDFLQASINLLKQFAENGGSRVAMAGTFAEYGDNIETLSDTESLVRPMDVYAKCKNFLNEISRLYCENNNVSFAWGRIFSAFGKEWKANRLTVDVINSLKAKKTITIRSGSLIRDYIYSKDVAAAFVKILDGNVQGNINICTGIETSIHDYVMHIAKKMGQEYLVDFVDQPGNQQRRTVGDKTRLEKEVGFTPQYNIDTAFNEILFD
jgi:nucleoside-diphosphate-sugar epimerase